VSGPCRDSCLRAGEPLAGSAGAAHALIALRWPKPRWHPDQKSLSRGLPAELRELESREKAAGRKLALRLYQDAAQPAIDEVELFAMRPGDDALFRAEVALDGLVPSLERWLSGDETALERSDAKLLLVCTDGRHDRCCAEHGRPVLEAMRASAPLDWRVLESSHIGGHRFAANCLALPSGRAYGRLAPEDVAPLAAALDEDRVYLPRYRGRFGLSEPAQAVEAFLHSRFPEARYVEPGAEIREDAGLRVAARVHLERGDHDVIVALDEQSFFVAASCGAPAEERVRWIPTGVLG
jgi:hypothetical protein